MTGTPRKLICVYGFAVSVSGAGETSTFVPGKVAECSSVAGRHEGEAPLDAVVVPEPDRSRVGEPSTMAAAAQASAATSRMMSPLRRI